jgi:Ser/Thr protein kinase RdoA (MazF antagonist)
LIIHGDYRPSNLLFRRGEPPVVLDFELARLEWRATDLARAGKVFARKRSMGLCFDRFKSFMDAYQAGCPVAEEELKLVPSVWQFLLIRRLMVCWYELCDAPNKEREAEIRDHLVWLDWLLAHEADLQAHLAPLESPTSGQKAKGD